MSDITFKFCWKKNNPDDIREARLFWERTRALDPEQIEERMNQLCALAYSDGQVAAASTGHFFDFKRLKSRFVYYRTIVDGSMRRQELALRLCVYSRDRLAIWARENPDAQIKGIFIVAQAREFHMARRTPYYTNRGINLAVVGYTPSGHQMRVGWFPDASVE